MGPSPKEVSLLAEGEIAIAQAFFGVPIPYPRQCIPDERLLCCITLQVSISARFDVQPAVGGMGERHDRSRE